MALPDAATLTPAQRQAAALRIKKLTSFTLPQLKWFNYEPCHRHAPERHPLCSYCGIEPRAHQRVGAAFLYLGLPSLLADTFGSGKTATTLLLLAQLKESGELSYDNRAVIICKPAALHDPWARELRRLTPGLDVLIADGPPREREAGYRGMWEVAVISSRTFAPAKGRQRARPGDVAVLVDQPAGILLYDDVDEMRSEKTKTFGAINTLAAQCTRVHGVHATPLQKRLTELWCFLHPVGGADPARLGSLTRVQQRFATGHYKWIKVPVRGDKTGRQTLPRRIWVEDGITKRKARVEEFREAIGPLVLRRTAKDFTDMDLPAVQVNPVFLDLLPAQRRRYDELRTGVLRVLTARGEQVSYTQAAAAFTRGWQICAGLASLDTGPDADISAKLDWTMDTLTGDLADEKVVCFVYHKGNVKALSDRLRAEGIGHVLMWSNQTDKRVRAERLRRFREDPRYRVLIGTTTIETSLNLQVARHTIAVDQILNPARMGQLAGRTARQGSPFGMVFLHMLLARDTQEEAYLGILRREAEVADIVWDEQTSIYKAFTPAMLMRMIAYGTPALQAA